MNQIQFRFGVAPGTELHFTILFIVGEMFDIYRTHTVVGDWNPELLTRALVIWVT